MLTNLPVVLAIVDSIGRASARYFAKSPPSTKVAQVSKEVAGWLQLGLHKDAA